MAIHSGRLTESNKQAHRKYKLLLGKQRLSLLVLLAHQALPLLLRQHAVPLRLTPTPGNHLLLSHVEHDTVRAHGVAAIVTEHDVPAISAAAAVAVVVVLLLPLVGVVLLQARLAQEHVLQSRMLLQILPISAMCAETALLGGRTIVVGLGVERLLRKALLQLGLAKTLRQ
mgnify:FL=1